MQWCISFSTPILPGPIFLDVDPDLFAPVLNYLRHDKLILGPSDVPGVLCVAHQLGLQRMEKELKDYMANQVRIWVTDICDVNKR